MNELLLQLGGGGTGSTGIILVLAATTAAAGLFVAFQAYRGYRRNASRPLLYLAIGIALLTAIPVGMNYLLSEIPGTTDAGILLVITVAHFAGVLAILYALTRA